jgi:hypothetical protein
MKLRILEIQKKSNEYLEQFTDNVTRVIESNEAAMLKMNRSQLMSSRDANDRPLIHRRTGSARLSAAYAKKTGKKRPNLFVNGAFQGSMFLTIPTEKDYIISSDHELVQFLPVQYGKIFGISPANQPRAQAVNNRAIVNDYLKTVFK